MGVKFPFDAELRINNGADMGAQIMSILPGLGARRPPEMHAPVTAVQEPGQITQTLTPKINTVLALVWTCEKRREADG